MTERQIARADLAGPKQPLTVAREIAARLADKPLKCWADNWLRYTGQHYERIHDTDARNAVIAELEGSFYQAMTKEGPKRAPWPTTPSNISNVMFMLKNRVAHVESTTQPVRLHSFSNGVLTIGENRARERGDHDCTVFNLASCDYPYEPDAAAPRWDQFLIEVLPNEEDRNLLQEFFGYVMFGGTEHHKMLSLSGKKRSGKGTILRILTALVGRHNQVSSSLKQLQGDFGLEPLIGKTLLTFGDVRWRIDDAREAVRLLLEISGEDGVAVNIKGHAIQTIRLGTRVVFAGNHVPHVEDPSGAFTERLLCVHFGESFAGREDTGLEGKLKSELPGILNWALDGADRLAANGRFTGTKATERIRSTVADSGQGNLGWVRDELVEADMSLPIAERRLTEDEVMERYVRWYTEGKHGKNHAGVDVIRNLIMEEFPSVVNLKNERGGSDRRWSKRGADGKTIKYRAFDGLAFAQADSKVNPLDPAVANGPHTDLFD